MKKTLIATVIVAAALVVAGGTYIYQKETSLPDYIASSNSRVTVERYDIASLYAGRVDSVLVSEGEQVNADQVLVKVDSAQATAKVEEANAVLASAQQNLQASKSQVVSAQQALDIAKLDYDNASRLRRQNLISLTEFKQREAKYTSAKADFEAANAAVEVAQARIAQAQAQLDSANSALGDLAIKAPIAGRVEYKLVNAGMVIGSGSRVVSILDPSDVYVNVFLTTDQVNQLSLGNQARVVIDGVDAVFPAKVTYIDSSAQFTPKSVETTEERTKLVFKVKLQVDQDVALKYKNYFRNGMTTMGYVILNGQNTWPSALKVKLPE
ncbi:hypothetical protein CJP74_03200 [Psittacicella melopsittaci]|uniref:Multidrug resistance protein MdtA-like barrel-sandwich hybrid domain-containing protein n=1 Tax=Psittacicella melopsittaci TaxID=2028576 RepID=A0A3A1Y3U8_9GAMM|nr:HlyD family efflux transporter periplasmic adaptor subunit [Psittacicella melopsittaci]RIY33002.1 hypothetical protein CJP74_03200 [Psittacicella melopsittaci]